MEAARDKNPARRTQLAETLTGGGDGAMGLGRRGGLQENTLVENGWKATKINAKGTKME